MWHPSLFGEFSAPLLSAALCHQVLPKKRVPENVTAAALPKFASTACSWVPSI